MIADIYLKILCTRIKRQSLSHGCPVIVALEGISRPQQVNSSHNEEEQRERESHFSQKGRHTVFLSPRNCTPTLEKAVPELSFAYPVWIAVVASYHYILARQPRTPMLKFVVVLVRKANWDAASFRKYFVEVHGPMAQRIPGLRQYRQNFPVRDANRSYPRWDGVIELYFDDYDSMQRAWQSAEGVQATKDLEVFSDLALSSWSVVDEINVALTNKQNPRKSV